MNGATPTAFESRDNWTSVDDAPNPVVVLQTSKIDTPDPSPRLSTHPADDANILGERIRIRLDQWAEVLQDFFPAEASDRLRAAHALAADILGKILDGLGSAAGMGLAALVDVTRLVNRAGTIRFLFGSERANDALVMPREILAAELAKLRGFMEQNHASLLETGLPATRFRRGCSLIEQLRFLFPVRMFRPLRPPPIATAYRPVMWYEWLHYGCHDDEAIPEARPVNREQANLLDGLSLQDAATIELLRPRILSLKIQILRDVEQALLQPEDRRLWEGSFQKLKNALSPEEIAFVERIEQIYHRSSMGKRNTSTALRGALGFGAPSEPGGLGGLKALLWHVESEKRFDLMHRLAKALAAAKLLQWRAHGCQRSTALKGISLGQLWLSRRRRRRVDAALDRYIHVEPKLVPLRAEFDRAIGTLYEAVDAGDLSLVHEEPPWQSMRDEMRQMFGELACKLTEQNCSHFPEKLPEDLPAEHYVFRRQNDTWVIRFGNSAPEPFRHIDGLMYIRKALERSGRPISYSEVSQEKAARSGRRSKANVDVGDGENGVLTSGNAGMSADLERARDPEGDQAFRKARETLQQRLDAAREEGCKKVADTLEAELEAFDKIWVQDSGLGGRAKLVLDGARRERDRITKAIKRALAKFEGRIPELYDHLVLHLNLQDNLIYDPPGRIHWQF